MDISNIPKTFWYSVSFCIIFLTISFVVIAWKSTSLTIEIANTKIGLSQAATRTEVVNEQLRGIAEELDDERKELQSLREEVIQLVSQAVSESELGIISVPLTAGTDASDKATKDTVVGADIISEFSLPDLLKDVMSRELSESKSRGEKERLERLDQITQSIDKTQMQIQQIKK
jgi:hypothetical protein